MLSKDKNIKDDKKVDKEKDLSSDIESDEVSQVKEKESQQAEEYLDQLKRLSAEFDNYRKRMDRASSEKFDDGMKSLASDLLCVLDNFERALNAGEADSEGITLIYREMFNILSKKGLNRMEAEGNRFDHNLHHAVGFVETTETDEMVAEVLQAGYFWNEELLRPAMVTVTKAICEKISDENSEIKQDENNINNGGI
ncbi:MAG: nucleotide exchange factor GrpE [Elusimicrobia bacterium]|nr:nucleotide exchange factor GrpE [Elusimicrobiota bacterium]